MGHSIPQTLRVLGHIVNVQVAILIDGGSTNNFIQGRVAKKLGLPLQPAQTFQLLVGNGEELQCSTICPQVCIVLGPHQFWVDLFVVPLRGAELVLGVELLKSLGPVLTDYNELTMSFIKEGRVVQLKGELQTGPKEATLHQLRCLVSTQAIDTFYQIHLTPPSPNTETIPSAITWLDPLLNTFSSLFSEPTTLPPIRPTDHTISIVNGANPVNVKLYRYLHFQKKEIENQIQQMLSQGIIQPSSSAFSSPVLLVRKKNGKIWRCCVDYRALNTITIKDRFPILTIDELLDELYGTKWFTKLDLRIGYHQIRMAPQDIHKIAFRTHQGHYESLVMPFGLCNAPLTFQATMNTLFQPYLRKFVIVFFDDILLYSRNLDDHRSHLEVVL